MKSIIINTINKLNDNANQELDQNKNKINPELQAALATSKALVRASAQTYWDETIIPMINKALNEGEDMIDFYPTRGSLGEKYINNSIFLFELLKLVHVNGMFLYFFGDTGTLCILFHSNIITTWLSKIQIMFGSAFDCRRNSY